MVRKLREYNKEKDGAINVGRVGLYTWNGEDYVSVEVLSMLNKKERPILAVYEGKTEAEIALFNEDGDELFVVDDSLEFEEDDFVTVGFKNESEDGKWMKWIIIIDSEGRQYPDKYEIINGKMDMSLDGSDTVKGMISVGEPSSAQMWIRKSKDYEVSMFQTRVYEQGDKNRIDILNNALSKMNECNYEFKPFDRVLVRDADDETWAAGIYSYYVDVKGCRKKHGVCGNDYGYEQCIHYEGNEDLWMTTNKPKEK